MSGILLPCLGPDCNALTGASDHYCSDACRRIGKMHSAHASQLADYARRLSAAVELNGAYIAENVRLLGVLERIEGGDQPCRDESVLRQWAYEGRVLNRDASKLSAVEGKP